MMGYDLDEIVGKHHGIFVDPDFLKGHEYAAIWEALGRGESQTAEFNRFWKNGEEVWLQASYTPFFDREGSPKVVKFATDVSERKITEAKIDAQHRAMMKMSTPVTDLE